MDEENATPFEKALTTSSAAVLGAYKVKLRAVHVATAEQVAPATLTRDPSAGGMLLSAEEHRKQCEHAEALAAHYQSRPDAFAAHLAKLDVSSPAQSNPRMRASLAVARVMPLRGASAARLAARKAEVSTASAKQDFNLAYQAGRTLSRLLRKVDAPAPSVTPALGTAEHGLAAAGSEATLYEERKEGDKSKRQLKRERQLAAQAAGRQPAANPVPVPPPPHLAPQLPPLPSPYTAYNWQMMAPAPGGGAPPAAATVLNPHHPHASGGNPNATAQCRDWAAGHCKHTNCKFKHA